MTNGLGSSHIMNEVHRVVERTLPVTASNASAIADRTDTTGTGNDQQAAPLVSIIINNYNYGRFIRDAIESALRQSYGRIEVLVVDDGSTDDSREIIESYGERLIPVFKANGGQASAFNAGFAHSRGDIVIFLDADDELLPDTVERVAKAFDDDPDLVKVQYRLEIVTTEGAPTGNFTPPAGLPLPSGDLRKHILRFPDDVRTPPASGNAFHAAALREIMPMPLNGGRTGADRYLFNLVPLFGTVVSLPSTGGRYRAHGSNSFYSSSLSLDRVRDNITRTVFYREYLFKHAQRLGLPHVPRKSAHIISVMCIANRMTSLRLEPDKHPIAGDSRFRLARLGIIAASRRFDLSRRTRALYMGWFVAAAFGPEKLTRWLVVQVFYPERRGLLGKLVS